jgi:crotonobetainyl-CoA:carnitine CoA-transferase CaiB-like acyl-CoA transferase
MIDMDKSMLEGVKIVDLTTVVFGPYSTQIMADLGAEVIKVEGKGGDMFRVSGKPAQTRGMAPGFLNFNRGKKSVKLDLKQPQDRDAMLALIAEADVFVTNVRGKALERLGLDFETVKSAVPEIIYAHCVGFGQDGPYADLQAYDDVIQAASGTATLLPRVDGNPAARYLPSLIADKVAGLHAAYGVLAAIVHKLRTGEGQFLEIPMFEVFTHFMMSEHLAGRTFEPANSGAGYSRQLDPDRQPCPTKDGYISIVPYEPDSWPRVFEVLGDAQFLAERGLVSPKDCWGNSALLYQRMAEVTKGFTTAELLDMCQSNDIPAQAVRDIDDILDDPHLKATDFFQTVEHDSEGTLRVMRAPVKFGADFTPSPLQAPRLGQHNDEVFGRD